MRIHLRGWFEVVLLLQFVHLVLSASSSGAIKEQEHQFSRRKVPLRQNLFSRNSRQTPDVPALYSAPKSPEQQKKEQVAALYSAPKSHNEPEVPALYSAPKDDENRIEFDSGTTESSGGQTTELSEGVSEDYEYGSPTAGPGQEATERPMESDSYLMRGKPVDPREQYGPPMEMRHPETLYGAPPPQAQGNRAPFRRPLDQQQIETTPLQHQIQIHVVPPHFSEPQQRNEIEEERRSSASGSSYLPPGSSELEGQRSREDPRPSPPPREYQTPRRDEEENQNQQKPQQNFQPNELNVGGYQAPNQNQPQTHFEGQRAQNPPGDYQTEQQNQNSQIPYDVQRNQPIEQGYQSPQQQSSSYPEQRSNGGYQEVNSQTGPQSYPNPTESQQSPNSLYEPQQQQFSSGGYQQEQGPQTRQDPYQGQQRSQEGYQQKSPQAYEGQQITSGGYEGQQRSPGGYQEQQRSIGGYEGQQGSSGGYEGQQRSLPSFEERRGGYEPQRTEEIYSGRKETEGPNTQTYDQQPANTNPREQQQSYSQGPPKEGQNGEYLPPSTVPEGKSVLNSIEQRTEELEGLNGQIVDAALLERVQQIIEQHEREQKALLKNIQNDNQAAFSNQNSNQQQNNYFPTQPQIQSQSDEHRAPYQPTYSAPSLNAQDFKPQAVYEDVGNNIQGQQRVQEHSGVPTPPQIEFQKALLSNHFTETETIPNPGEYLPPRNSGFQPSTSFGASGPVAQPQSNFPQARSYNNNNNNDNFNIKVGAGLRVGPGQSYNAYSADSAVSPSVDTPRPIYGVPLAPVIGLDSQENLHVVDDGTFENSLLNHPFMSAFQTNSNSDGFYGRNRRRAGIVTRLNTYNPTPAFF